MPIGQKMGASTEKRDARGQCKTGAFEGRPEGACVVAIAMPAQDDDRAHTVSSDGLEHGGKARAGFKRIAAHRLVVVFADELVAGTPGAFFLDRQGTPPTPCPAIQRMDENMSVPRRCILLLRSPRR